MSKEYYIDFSGYCVIEADSREEAEQMFWHGVQPPSTYAYDDVYDIDDIELIDPAKVNKAIASYAFIDPAQVIKKEVNNNVEKASD